MLKEINMPVEQATTRGRMRWLSTLVTVVLLVALLLVGCGSPEAQVSEEPPVEPTAPVVEEAQETVPEATVTAVPPTEAPEGPPSFPTETGAIQPVTFETLPQLTSDLLFLDGGRLIHWDHERNQLDVVVEPEEVSQATAEQEPTWLPGAVLGFSVSADSSRVAMVRRWHESHDEIVRFEPATGLVETMLQQEREIFTFALSPDGEWVAYMVKVYSDDGAPEGPIYLFPWNNPAAQVEIGRCAAQYEGVNRPGCGEKIIWSPDSRQVAWSDGFGVWLKDLQESDARQLFVHTLVHLGQEETSGLARLLAWAPTGRYLLTQVVNWENSNKQLLDTETGQMTLIPDSYITHTMSDAFSTWLTDGRLFVINPYYYADENNQERLARLWRLDPATPEVLILDGEFSLGTEGFPGLPTQRTDGYLSVASEGGQEAANGHLVIIDPTSLEMIPMSTLPNQARNQLETVWAPDNSGAIVSARGGGMPLYIPADGQVVYDLTPIMRSAEPCCFKWLSK